MTQSSDTPIFLQPVQPTTKPLPHFPWELLPKCLQTPPTHECIPFTGTWRKSIPELQINSRRFDPRNLLALWHCSLQIQRPTWTNLCQTHNCINPTHHLVRTRLSPYLRQLQQIIESEPAQKPYLQPRDHPSAGVVAATPVPAFVPPPLSEIEAVLYDFKDECTSVASILNILNEGVPEPLRVPLGVILPMLVELMARTSEAFIPEDSEIRKDTERLRIEFRIPKFGTESFKD